MRMEQRFKLINKEKQIKYNNMSEKVEKPDPKAEKINDLMAVVTNNGRLLEIPPSKSR